jgi:MFS transporter, PAT family, beta-lactamase induction signal transducer AmpG
MLPAFRSRRVAVQLPLGFAAGLPYLLSGQTLQTWMAHEKIDLGTVGLMTLVGLPYSLKFLWAPVIDRFALPWLGRRRGWMIVTQLLVAAAILVTGLLPIRAAAVAAVGLALLSATFDIANDAYRTDVLTEEERASGTAVYVTGYRIGMIAAGALALIIAGVSSWRVAYAVMAALMASTVVATLLAPEGPPSQHPRTLLLAVILPLKDLFLRPGAVWILSLSVLFQVGYRMSQPMTQPFLLDLGFSLQEIGAVVKGLGLVATIAGGLVAGGLVARLGLWRSLVIFGLAQALSDAAYAMLAVTGKSHVGLVLTITVDNFCTGLATSAFVAFLMAQCNRALSATQYAILTSLSSVSGRVLGVPSGYLAQAIGWPMFFICTLAIGLPAIALVILRRRSWTSAP